MAGDESPSWDRLFEAAADQLGLFTTEQAATAGYSSQLLHHHVHHGRVQRVRRGIYRVVHFPRSDQEDLVVVWLWSDRAGVFSGPTALALHGLSDVMPVVLHMTLPLGWRHRRLRVPDGTQLSFADVLASERTWVGAVPATSVARTLNDCARDHLSPDLLQQAVSQALQRGLVAATDLGAADDALAPFGGR